MRSLFLACSLAAAAMLPGCRSTNVTTEAPAQVTPSQVYTRKLSVINIPFSLNIKQLEAKLNRDLTGILYNDDNLAGDNIKIRVTKIGNIGLTANNNMIYFTLPVRVWAYGEYSWKACDLCPAIGTGKSTEFDITVSSQSFISVTDNWQVKTLTTGSYEWGKTTPGIEIGPIKIPIASLVDMALKPQMSKLTAMLDKEIQSRVDIKSYAQQAWNQVQQPVEIDKATNTWLLISPQELRMSPLQCVNNTVNIKLGIKSYIEAVSGGKPAVKVNTVLPRLITDAKMADDFSVGLTGEITYAQATEMLKKELAGKLFSFEDGKYEMQIDNLELTGNANTVQIKMDVQGKARKGARKKIKGTVYLQGIPYYDVETSSVRIKDFDFAVNSKNMLLKSAAWVAHIGFEKKIRESLVFPLKDKIEEAKKMIQSELAKGQQLPGNILLKGSLTNLVPEGIYLSPTSMKAVVLASGKVNLQMTGF